MDDFFTDDELAQLRAHGIVLFAGRVIFDAQPPINAQQLAVVEAACIGPVPPGLLSLWRQTCGGALDYDLSVRMGGGEEPILWAELFGHGPEGFHDLPGWIAHERQAGASVDSEGKAWSPKLAALPFGGFEDTDRLYVLTEPGAQFGHVLLGRKRFADPHVVGYVLQQQVRAALEDGWRSGHEVRSREGRVDNPSFYRNSAPRWEAASFTPRRWP